MSIKDPSMSKSMKVLCISAHSDDLEIMAGGTLAKWHKEGHKIRAITLSDSVWKSPDGKIMRTNTEALDEENKAAAILGYSVENLGLPAMDLRFEDKLVMEVLARIEKYKIDTVICPWEGDLHHDHEIASRVALAACRRVPRVLMGQVNHYLRRFFTPNVFVNISSTWETKIESIKAYEGQWKRAGHDWYEFLDATSRYYGKMVGVERAEGFICDKYLL